MRRRYIECLLLGLFVLAICSCASQTVIPPVYNYQERAIRLHIFADNKLNFYDGKEHALHLCVYQLREPNAFKQLSYDKDGLYKLLSCGRFDQSVTSFDRIVVQPGRETIETFDRAEGTKYVGVAAGYYTFQVLNMTQLFEIPVITETQGWLKITKIEKPGPLNMDIFLGSEGIEKSEVKE